MILWSVIPKYFEFQCTWILVLQLEQQCLWNLNLLVLLRLEFGKSKYHKWSVVHCIRKSDTVCFVWKNWIWIGFRHERIHFWLHVGKAKMYLKNGRFIQFSKDSLHFSSVCIQFFKQIATSQTHFDLTNMGSKLHSFRATGICNPKISNETPFTFQFKISEVHSSVQEWVGVSRVSRKCRSDSESTQSRFLSEVDSRRNF